MPRWGFECRHCGASSTEYVRSETRPIAAAPLCKCGYGMEPFLAAEPTTKPPSLSVSSSGSSSASAAGMSSKANLPRMKSGRRTPHKFPSSGRWSAKDRSIMRNGKRLK